MKTNTSYLDAQCSQLMLITLSLLFALPGLTQEPRNFFPFFGSTDEGNSSLSATFTGSPSSTRFQQVYGASGFISEGGNTQFLIHRIQLRTDGTGPGFFSQFPAFQINFSTTTRPIDDLSATFIDNIGSDDTAVVPLGQLQVSGSYVRGNEPQLMTTFITFSTPFYYDPSQGNLLMDIRNFGGGTTSWGVPPFSGPAYVDASRIEGDLISSVIGSSVNALSGSVSTVGLISQFWVTQVPEPSTVTLLLVGLIAFGFSARSRQTRKG